MKVYGQLENASLENLSADPTVAIGGRIYINTATGKTMVDDGSIKRALLRNDQACVFGSDSTAANNVRFHHAGVGLLQFVIGNDTTAENTSSTALAQVGLRVSNLAAAPAVGNPGRVFFNTAISTLQFDTGTAIQQLATLAGSETLSNKTLVTPALDLISVTDQTGTPSTPAAGITKLYTRGGKLARMANDGVELIHATLSASETLTNKTLTAPTLTTPTADVLLHTDQAATPTTPASGTVKFYTRGGVFYFLTSAGVETIVGSSTATAVNARYSCNQQNTLPSGATSTIVYNLASWDTNNLVTQSPWKFTATAATAGKYAVYATIKLQSGTYAGAQIPYLSIYKNGTEISRGPKVFITTAGSQALSFEVEDDVQLASADYIDVRWLNASSNQQALTGTAIENYITIKKIG